MTPADLRLRDACRNGVLVDAIKALDEGASVHATDSMGRTALHWAACAFHAVRASQYVDICIMLVDQGADINSNGDPDRSAGTPLLCAASMESLTHVELTGDALIALGADIRSISSHTKEGLRLLCLDRLQAAAKSGRADLMLRAIEDDWDHETVHERLQETAAWAREELPAPELMIHTMRVWMSRRQAGLIAGSLHPHCGFHLRMM